MKHSIEHARSLAASKMRPAAGLAALLFLGACASITPVSGPLRTSGGLSVTLDGTWSDITPLRGGTPGSRSLTLDGPLLDEMVLASGIKPGKPFVRAASKEKPTPVYRADMSFNEQVEFITESLAAMGYMRVETRDLRPQPLGQATGVRFELDAQRPDGLNVDGTVLAAPAGGSFHFVMFLAAEEHYFPTLRERVEKVLASAAVK